MQKLLSKTFEKQSYAFWLICLFWIAANMIFSYVSPVLVEERFDNNLAIGILISLSALTGIVVDVVADWKFSHKPYSFFYITGFFCALLASILLLYLQDIFLPLIFILAGGYFELLNFAGRAFLSHEYKIESHTRVQAMVSVLATGVGLATPLIINHFLVAKDFSFALILFATMMALGAFSFLFLKQPETGKKKVKPKARVITLLTEFKIWRLLTRKTRYVLLLLIMISAFDAVFWTLGPIMAIKYSIVTPYAALLLPVYLLPGLLAGLMSRFLENIKRRKLVTYGSFLLGCLAIMTLGFLTEFTWILFFVFLSNVFMMIAYILLETTMLGLMDQLGDDENYLIGLEGIAADIGYLLAPLAAGFVATLFSLEQTIAVSGVFFACATVLMILKAPEQIKLPLRQINILEGEKIS